MKFYTKWVAVVLIVFTLGCKETPEEPGLSLPTNLETTLIEDNAKKGLVKASISADNANYYQIWFELPNGEFEEGVMNGGESQFTYYDSGMYLVKLRAHVTDRDFSEVIDSIHIVFKASSINDGYTTPKNYPGYNLVWADEFEGNMLDETSWTYETGRGEWGWGNNELQYYQSGTNNCTVENGLLTITAKAQAAGDANYTSARIKTQGKREFKYGRIDIRARLPKTQGLWPALWMLGADFVTEGWPACGEIDIMELVGHLPKEVFGTAHWGSTTPSKSHSRKYRLTDGSDFSDSFHVFTLLWEENNLKWLVDDKQYNELAYNNTFPFNDDFFFIFNVAVGGQLPGNPDATTRMPQSMQVDYVRVFQPQ